MTMLRFEKAIYQERVSMKGIVCYYPKISIQTKNGMSIETAKLLDKKWKDTNNPKHASYSYYLIIEYNGRRTISIPFGLKKDLQLAIDKLDELFEVRPIH